jgi:hypothetical protein
MWNKMKLMFSAIWVMVLPLLKTFSGKVGKAVLAQAISVCQDVAVSMATANGADKRKAAFKLIVANLKTQGVQNVETSVINAAIETAVQYLEAKE